MTHGINDRSTRMGNRGSRGRGNLIKVIRRFLPEEFSIITTYQKKLEAQLQRKVTRKEAETEYLKEKEQGGRAETRG